MSTRYATVLCDECKHEFSMNSVNIQEANMRLGGQDLVLVYFTCPKCNKIYRIALKDERYEDLKEDLERTKKRIRRNYGSRNDELARTLDSMVRAKLVRLRNHVEKLNSTYPGTFTFVASENNHEDNIITYLP